MWRFASAIDCSLKHFNPLSNLLRAPRRMSLNVVCRSMAKRVHFNFIKARMHCSPVCGFERWELKSNSTRMVHCTTYIVQRPALVIVNVHIRDCRHRLFKLPVSFSEFCSEGFRLIPEERVSGNGGGIRVSCYHRRWKFYNLILFMFHIFWDHFSIVRFHSALTFSTPKRWRFIETWEHLHFSSSFLYRSQLMKIQCSFNELLVFHFFAFARQHQQKRCVAGKMKNKSPKKHQNTEKADIVSVGFFVGISVIAAASCVPEAQMLQFTLLEKHPRKKN